MNSALGSFVVALVLVGCGQPVRSPTREDAGRNPQTRDSGVLADGGTQSELDAGAPDSGPVDAGESSDAGGSVWCEGISSAVICDSFEDENVSIRWTVATSTESMASNSTEKATDGARSLRATAADGDGDPMARYEFENETPIASGDLWMQFRLYVPSWVDVTGVVSVAQLGDLQFLFHSYSMAVWDASARLSYQPSGGVLVPRDRWICVELHVSIDSTNGTLSTFVDGSPFFEVGAHDTVPGDGYTTVRAGVVEAHTGQGLTQVFIDQFVVATERVGCQ